MMDRSETQTTDDWANPCKEEMEREVQRANARLRHFRGIAASVMGDALMLWREIWDGLQDPRSCGEILHSSGSSLEHMSDRDRGMLLEKLHLLGIQIDYARRLCEGSIGSESHDEGGL